MAKVSRDVFGFKHPKMPKEFWAFFLIAIILCSIWKTLLVYLVIFIVVGTLMLATTKDPNDPFSDLKK
jgi:uncharacterized membrane protein